MIVTLHDKSKEKPHFGEVFYLILIYSFAAIGALFVSVFFANRFRLTNVSGSVDILSNSFQKNYRDNTQILGVSTATNSVGIDKEILELNLKREQLISYLCNLKIITPLAPKNVSKIIEVKRNNGSLPAISSMIFTVKTHLTNLESVDKNINNCIDTYRPGIILEDKILAEASTLSGKNIFIWPENPEWQILVGGVSKDLEVINQAAKIAQIDPRLIVSSLVVEQLRLYYSQRELYKKFFEPLKILANANKFSLGVMSIKEETAVAIEKHLKDSSSPFYLGKEFETALDFPNSINPKNFGSERYNRLTANNHYYNYLYGAIYLKQFIVQWQKAGFNISQRPEIVGTLFNLGFGASKPNENPMVGGSNISIGGTSYSFGRLASEFYYSGEMSDIFPYSD